MFRIRPLNTCNIGHFLKLIATLKVLERNTIAVTYFKCAEKVVLLP